MAYGNESFPVVRRDLLKTIGLGVAAGAVGLGTMSRPVAASSHTQPMTVRSGTSSQVVGYRAGADAGAFPTSTPNAAADLAWVHPAWSGTSHTFDSDTRWIWHCDRDSSTGQTVGGEPTYYVKEPIAGDVVELEDTFTVPGTPVSGTLYITADNGYEVSVNGTAVGSAQVFDSGGTDWEDSDLGQTYINAQSGTWISVEDFDVSSLLVSGSNTLTVLGGNEQQSTADGESNGTVTSNPGGVIYELDIEYEVETCEECTSDDLLAKYEFACVETDPDTGECVAYDFVFEKGDDSLVSYVGFTPDEDGEPESATFETEYCLWAVVKSGQQFSVQAVDPDNGTVENSDPYAISFVAFFCTEDAAEEFMDSFPSKGRGGGRGNNQD